MSHGIDILRGKKIDTFTEDLPISERTSDEWLRELIRLGRPAIKSFDMGTMAARILAGRFPEKFENGNFPEAFILNARREDPGRFWFTRGIILLAPPLELEINHEGLVNPPESEAEAVYHAGARLVMSGVRMPRLPEHDFDILPKDATEVFSFQIYTPGDLAIITEAETA